MYMCCMLFCVCLFKISNISISSNYWVISNNWNQSASSVAKEHLCDYLGTLDPRSLIYLMQNSGYSQRILSICRMSNKTIIDIEKFNGHSFQLWKLKMEYLLVNQEQWIIVKHKTKLMGTSDED